MDNTKKDWTAEERARFERIFLIVIQTEQTGSICYQDIYNGIDKTERIISILDKHYKNTSHEPTN
jgi:hypothetical protein